MAVIKCKMCGGAMELSTDKTCGTCEYCGSTMTLPKVDDDQRAAAFNRGNHFRRIGEFDKALAVYEKIIQEDDSDAEAHWCCALCRFGIEYVQDPASGEYLPTCHRASFDSFLEDVDYKAALEHADVIARAQYQRDGEKIAEVQRGILTTVQKEQPFDVFLCYKETGEDRQRTVDSTLAQDIYYQLTEQGRRVFFARITLEDKAGQEYEPYIFAALNSAKVMVVVGTRPEHFNAVWVRNEWSRYLALMKHDRKRLLLPCYRDMDPYDLPEQLAVLQSYDMSKIGFIQDLIRGIAKVLDADKPKAEPVRETSVVQSEGGANTVALLKRGYMALEDGDWDKADGFFEQVLNMNAECAEAYWGKVLVAARCNNAERLAALRINNAVQSAKSEVLTAFDPDEKRIAEAVTHNAVSGYLTEAAIRSKIEEYNRTYNSRTSGLRRALEQEKTSFTKDRQISRALRYARGDFADKLAETRRSIETGIEREIQRASQEDEQKRSAVAAGYEDRFALIKDLGEDAVQKRRKDYDAACEAQKKADTEQSFRETAERFNALGDFLDCADRAKQCENAAVKLAEEVAAEAKRLAEESAAEVERQRIQQEKEIASRERKKRNRLIVAASTVVAVVAVILLVTQVVIPNVKYKNAKKLLVAGDYDGAAMAFAELGDFKDAAEQVRKYQYTKGETALLAGEKAAAAVAFGKAGDYSDARERANAIWRDIMVRETISAGEDHTVGLKSNGTVVAVGSKIYGELDFGKCEVSGWTDIVAVSAGWNHTVGLKSDGTVVAVGTDTGGVCNVSGWTDIVAVSAGWNHTVGLKSDGTVVAVGYTSDGKTDVSSWENIVAVSAGGSLIVGLKSDGTVVTAGKSDGVQCDVSGWTDIMAVSAGDYHTVGLKTDGTVVAVGNNAYGQCNVSGWTDIVAVSAGGYDTVGLKSDGTVVISAVDPKSAGTIAASSSREIYDLSDWTDIVAVSVGGNHTVGLKSDGTVVAAGTNSNGRCNVSGWTGIKLPR